MSSQFVLKQNAVGGFEVHARDLVSREEYHARYQHMVSECGFSPDEATRELAMMTSFRNLNRSEVCPRNLCEALIWDYSDPGDILTMDGRTFVVNRPGAA